MGGMESTAGVRLHNHRRKLRQRFDIIKKLGQGTYGKVQLGINKETGQEVAIKTIKKSKIESEADLVRIRREIQIMSSVQHPNIIHIYEVFENREKMVLVMEYAAGGELYDFLSERKVLGEEEARRLFRQIATAVYYCHKHKICHRDLKLENILLDENGSAKIADFGLSNVFDETRLLGTFCGSPLYASPEIVQGTPYHGPEVDCWSLGVLLYTLVYGAMPFDGSNFKRLVKQISQGDYFEPKKPSPASPLIREMLTVSPTQRADIVKICSHWWVNEGQSESCLDIAEHLANQTPVRLDLLLSLAPPVSAEQVVVTTDQKGNGEVAGAAEGPVRSHSVGSLMDLDQPSAERRIRDFVNATKTETSKSRANIDKAAETSKRKLEDAVSTDDASVGGGKKKERSRSKQRSGRSDRRSSSRSRKQAETMDVESDNILRSDSKDLTLAAARAINESLQDKPTESSKGESAEKTEEKRKSVKGTKKKVKPEKDEGLVSATGEPEAVVAEGKSGSEPTQEAKVPVTDASPMEESTKGKVKRKSVDGDQSKRDSVSSTNEKLSDLSPSDESVRSSQSEPCVEEVKDDVNGDDMSEGVVSIVSSSTAPVSSLSLSDTGADIASLDKTKSQGRISLSKIINPTNEVPIAVPMSNVSDDVETPRSTERRKSKIFETAEKFNTLASTDRKGSAVEKPRKIHIPGVKVSDAKAAYERKSSITSSTTTVPAVGERKGSITSVPAGVKSSLSKKTVQDQSNVIDCTTPAQSKASDEASTESSTPVPETPSPDDNDRAKKVKDAVGVISSIIEGQVTGRKVSLKKTPKLNSFDGSTPGTPVPSTPLSPTAVDPITGLKTVRVQVAPNDIRTATIQVSTPQATKYPGDEPPLPTQTIQTSVEVEEGEPKKAASKMEITLKSATLPRRKTSEAKIQMGTPPPAKASSPEKLERMIQAPPSPGRRASVGQPLGGYRSEVEHMVGAADYPNRPRHQRSEVSFPVAAAGSSTRIHPMPFRSASCEPESSKSKPREHIIPIHFEADENAAPRTSTPPAKPPVPPTTSQSASGNLPYQRTLSQLSHRSNSLSRQSTQDSDTESTISQSGGEPIRKSPREFIIPIAMEGGGYVTPRAASLEPSEDNRASTHSLPRSRLGSRTKRMSSLLSESEDEGPFAALHRHSSIGRDSDNEDRPSAFHLHRLRSSRPSQRTLEHTDSMSSAEEEDDDEGFELLTAENLFSSLLSRVRSLTQRLNVEDGGRPGFPSPRLLSQFGSHPRASPFMFPSTSLLSRGSPFEPLSSIHNTGNERIITTTFKRISETSRSFSRNDSDAGSVGTAPWRRSVSRDVSDTDSIYSESQASGTLPKARVRVSVHVPGAGGRKFGGGGGGSVSGGSSGGSGSGASSPTGSSTH